MTLTVNLNASIKLFSELSKKITNSKHVLTLSHKSKELTKRLKNKYNTVQRASSNNSWCWVKKEVNAALHCEQNNQRNQLLKKAWKWHFQNTETSILKAQFANSSIIASDEDVKSSASLQYDILEWDDIVWLTCESVFNSTNHRKHAQRLETLQACVALCDWQESQHHAQSHLTQPLMKSVTTLRNYKENSKNCFSLMCKLMQCIFCLSNDHKSYLRWMFEYIKPHQMMNKIKRHLKRYTSENKVWCSHSQCKTVRLVLFSVMVFKNHTAKVHKISLHTWFLLVLSLVSCINLTLLHSM